MASDVLNRYALMEGIWSSPVVLQGKGHASRRGRKKYTFVNTPQPERTSALSFSMDLSNATK